LLVFPIIFIFYSWQVKRLNRLGQKLSDGIDMVVDESSKLVLTPAQALALAGYDKATLMTGTTSSPGSPKGRPLTDVPVAEPSASSDPPPAICDGSDDDDWVFDGAEGGDDHDIAMPQEMVDPETHTSFRAPAAPPPPSPPPLPALDQDGHSDGPLDDPSVDAGSPGGGETSEEPQQPDPDVDWYDADIALEAVDSAESAQGSDGPRATLPVARRKGPRGQGCAHAPAVFSEVAQDDDAVSSLSL